MSDVDTELIDPVVGLVDPTVGLVDASADGRKSFVHVASELQKLRLQCAHPIGQRLELVHPVL
jgi:hypothetical protein